MSSRPRDSSPAETDGSARQPLESMAPYLLSLATENLPKALWPKIAPSDIVQEALYEASRAPEQFRGTRQAQLKAWLRTIVVNKVIDAQRRFRRARKRSVDQERALSAAALEGFAASQTSPSGRVSKGENRERLIAALARLPEERRQVIVLRDFDGLEFAEIARRLGRSTAAVRSLWWRAIESLRAELDQSHER